MLHRVVQESLCELLSETVETDLWIATLEECERDTQES